MGALFNFIAVKKCPFLYLLDANLSFQNSPWQALLKKTRMDTVMCAMVFNAYFSFSRIL